MLDLAKAFDSVDREMASQILLSRGAPPKLVALIRDLHKCHSAVIRSEVDSAPVGTSVGFKQKMCLLHSYAMSVFDSGCHLPATAATAWRHHLLQDKQPTRALQELHRGGADVDSGVC